MSDLPSGTLTLLFTDIEGSTRLLNELGDGYADVLAEHRRVLREAFRSHDGIEVDTQGDAFFYVFASAKEALCAAAQDQNALHEGPEESHHAKLQDLEMLLLLGSRERTVDDYRSLLAPPTSS
jgi:class 3 adenylate cyclase